MMRGFAVCRLSFYGRYYGTYTVKKLFDFHHKLEHFHHKLRHFLTVLTTSTRDIPQVCMKSRTSIIKNSASQNFKIPQVNISKLPQFNVSQSHNSYSKSHMYAKCLLGHPRIATSLFLEPHHREINFRQEKSILNATVGSELFQLYSV